MLQRISLVLYLLLLQFLVIGCSEQFKLPENAAELLTNNSTKTWKLAMRLNDGHRMNMGDCFLSYRITYNIDGTTIDNNAEHKDCGESLEADWSFYTNDDGSFIKLEADNLKALLKQKNDYKYFKILKLSDSLMIISFRHKQFGNVTRTIVDHLVPEHIEVKGRNYHN